MDLWLLFQNVALIDPSTHFACLPNRSSHLLLYISSISFLRPPPFIPFQSCPPPFIPPPPFFQDYNATEFPFGDGGYTDNEVGVLVGRLMKL